MLCLLDAPSQLDQALYPGAKSRYDDFVVIHMNQTMSIHGTVSGHGTEGLNFLGLAQRLTFLQGNFLVWHRYYTWLFERELRNECGYTGTQPVSHH